MPVNLNIENNQFNPDGDQEFDHCIFKNSRFVNYNFGGFEFTDCTFINCDFSSARFDRLLLVRTNFIDCKILGVDFSQCSKFNFSVQFQNSILDYCFFQKLILKKARFIGCSVVEATFLQCDLSKCDFSQSNLNGTKFEGNNLEGSDFRSAINYKINPALNQMKGAQFHLAGIMGLLEHWGILVDDIC